MKIPVKLFTIATLAVVAAFPAEAGQIIFEESFESHPLNEALATGSGVDQWRTDGYSRTQAPGSAKVIQDSRLNDTNVLRTTPSGDEKGEPATLFNVVREFSPVTGNITFSVDVTPLVGTSQISLYSAEKGRPTHHCTVHLRTGRELKALALERDGNDVVPVEIAPILPGKKYRVVIHAELHPPARWSVKLIDLETGNELGSVSELQIKAANPEISHFLIGTTHAAQSEALWDNIRLEWVSVSS